MINEKIKTARADMNMSQAALARAVGVNQSTIASWEKGRTEPDTIMVGRLAQVLKVTTDNLLGIQSEQLVLPEGVADLAKKIADLSPGDRAVVEKVVAALGADDKSKVVPG
ncbi:transcriptional regulator with XRE-family HTH domain [Sporomusaceae bacterium BoRhaA]|uniref:helix-turn-helix transcriptional regulator n=1 Tax=Pelorhabdus rhamnosifermentans TaxID=2772457 RepID=UPI001C061322|nr:helix-turn-helix transcriptional regulator [Pelorhabdus rhamnosifermentans]MBU2704015.1 transcriptional regulator with XRE-family HTH domain [Pelorhabdus rhamnosifermentans]